MKSQSSDSIILAKLILKDIEGLNASLFLSLESPDLVNKVEDVLQQLEVSIENLDRFINLHTSNDELLPDLQIVIQQIVNEVSTVLDLASRLSSSFSEKVRSRLKTKRAILNYITK